MTDEDETIKAQIANLEAKIERRRQQDQHAQTPPSRPLAPPYYRGAARWAPYGRGRGRGRGGRVPNRQLVFKRPDQSTSASTANGDDTRDSFVATHTHQLVNRDALERQRARRTAMQKTKRHKINQDESSHLIQHTSQQGHELVIEGVRFQLRDDGSKLVRATGQYWSNNVETESLQLNHADNAPNIETPKIAKVAGVDFYRTKHGNLVRANAVKGITRYLPHKLPNVPEKDPLINSSRSARPTSTPQCEHFIKNGNCLPSATTIYRHTPNKLAQLRRQRPLPRLMLILLPGKCPFGQSCRFAHDPEQVAICPAFLKDRCSARSSCDLSHTVSYHRVPACLHFLRGNCTNDACRYPHVYVSPSAAVCRPFARLGYCANVDCDKRHIFECPDYASDGVCANKACQLPHIDHAAVLRKVAVKQARLDSEDYSDISSDEKDDQPATGFDDIDSDEAEDFIMGNTSEGGHELSQQQDFVPLS